MPQVSFGPAHMVCTDRGIRSSWFHGRSSGSAEADSVHSTEVAGWLPLRAGASYYELEHLRPHTSCCSASDISSVVVGEAEEHLLGRAVGGRGALGHRGSM